MSKFRSSHEWNFTDVSIITWHTPLLLPSSRCVCFTAAARCWSAMRSKNGRSTTVTLHLCNDQRNKRKPNAYRLSASSGSLVNLQHRSLWPCNIVSFLEYSRMTMDLRFATIVTLETLGISWLYQSLCFSWNEESLGLACTSRCWAMKKTWILKKVLLPFVTNLIDRKFTSRWNKGLFYYVAKK